MANKLIYLDAGHGGSDPGAVKYIREADANIKVVNYMYNYLINTYVVDVYKDISSDSLNTICSRANNKKADLFVSIHFNADGGDGFEALVYSSKNKALGQLFVNEAVAIGQNSRGVKYRPDLGVLRLTNMPSVLNEIAFVDNYKDIQDWNEDAEFKKMGEAMAKAAAKHLNLSKKSGVKTESVSSTTSNTTVKKDSPKVAFIKGIQKSFNAKVDGIAGKETLSKTITISKTKNNKHLAVKYIQSYLNTLGYNCGTPDGVAGDKFDQAVKKYQMNNGCVADGELTATGKTWKKLLDLS